MKIPPIEILDALAYDPETGLFTWKAGARSGRIAGTLGLNGYTQIVFRNVSYLAHRLAFFFMIGRVPASYTDHINGVRNDNRWVNLRECDASENSQNTSIMDRPRKYSPLPGVSFQAGRFIAQIRVRGRNLWLGRHDTIEQAHEAYMQAKAKYHTFNPTIR